MFCIIYFQALLRIYINKTSVNQIKGKVGWRLVHLISICICLYGKKEVVDNFVEKWKSFHTSKLLLPKDKYLFYVLKIIFQIRVFIFTEARGILYFDMFFNDTQIPGSRPGFANQILGVTSVDYQPRLAGYNCSYFTNY